ncbi:MAG TPA: heparinase II/III-family protein, partial [Anaerolineae bacterium]|nr:heparinase II/III-family protein [Anaerolineae bacterium]
LIPLLSDSALEDTYLRFSAARGGPTFLDRSELKAVAPALDEASIWLLGSQRVKPYLDSPAQVFDLNSRAFPNGGYFVMHQGQGAAAAYLVFDCGPFGYKPVPSHGHADALSFELHAHGQTWIVDPGIYSTHLGDDWRNFFRGSRAHNTVVVDRQDQSVLMDIWRVYRPAQASLHHWFASDHFDFVDGSHDGYERLQEPVSHRRQIFFAKPEYWVIVDSLTGQGQHCFETYFHLMPGLETQLERESGTLQVSNGSGSGLMIAPLAPHLWQPEVIIGATAPIQGWVSFFSGEKQPAPTLRYHQEAVAPLQFCTVLYPYQGSKQQVQLSIAPLMVEVQGRSSAKSELTGLRLETATHVDYLVIDRGGAGARKTFGAFETDAQLSYIRCQKEDQQPVKVVVRGGSQLLFEGRSLLEASQNKGLIVDAGS